MYDGSNLKRLLEDCWWFLDYKELKCEEKTVRRRIKRPHQYCSSNVFVHVLVITKTFSRLKRSANEIQLFLEHALKQKICLLKNSNSIPYGVNNQICMTCSEPCITHMKNICTLGIRSNELLASCIFRHFHILRRLNEFVVKSKINIFC